MTAQSALDDLTREQGATLEVQGLSKSFGDKQVLTEVNLSVPPGEFVAVVGHSGCGKSTLLRIVAGLEQPTSGVISETKRTAVGFQDSRLIPWQRVWRNVIFGLRGSRSELRARALSVLAEVGLEEYADAWPSTLSGGQAQRVSLARALTVEPELLLLDEPFGALDALTRLKAQALVHQVWQTHGFATLLVTHDIEEAVLLSDRVIVIDQGRVAHEVEVELTRPRERADVRMAEYRARILEYLGFDAL